MSDLSDEDTDNTRSSRVLLERIKNLEREKAELETRENEKQLLKKLKELEGDVKTMKQKKTSTPIRSPEESHSKSKFKSGRRSQEIRNVSFDDNDSVLSEIQSRFRSIPHTSRQDVDQAEDPDESDEASEEDDGYIKTETVMSNEKKQRLHKNRDTLVENVIPEDIFNDLIANKILSTADVSRIKEKNTREAMNEELLNILGRRSNRAFEVFVESLRKTLQGHLADIIDPSSRQKKKNKRKRKSGEINVSVDCGEVTPLSKKRTVCTCEEVEQQILEMAKNAFRYIRRRDGTPASFEQFRKELQQTNLVIKESLEISNTLKILCSQCRSLSGVTDGSVVIVLLCHTTNALLDLWNMYITGKLLQIIENGFLSKSLMLRLNVSAVKLSVRIAKDEYVQCMNELKLKQLKQSSCQIVSLKMRKSPVCTRSMTKTNSENVAVPILSSKNAVHTCMNANKMPRRAFSEITNISSPQGNTAQIKTAGQHEFVTKYNTRSRPMDYR